MSEPTTQLATTNGGTMAQTGGPAAAPDAMMNAGAFQQMQRIARAMATSSLCPKHLKGRNHEETIGNCLRVVNQAHRWGMDPFPVADTSYVVRGKLAFEGKMVAAVVNSRAGLEGRLKPMYNSASGKDFAVVVYGSEKSIPDSAFKLLDKYAAQEDRKALSQLSAMGIMAVRLSVAQGMTDNEMWRKDPEQKLWYTGVTKWARRYAPELMLGVTTDHDAEVIAEQPGPAAATSQVTTLDDVVEHLTKDTEGEADPEPEAEPEDEPQGEQPTVDVLAEPIALIERARSMADIDALDDLYVGPNSKLAPHDIARVSKLLAGKRSELEAAGVQGGEVAPDGVQENDTMAADGELFESSPEA